MKITRWICILLLAALCLPLASCAGGEAGPADTQAAGQTTEAAADTTAAPQKIGEYTVPSVNYDGQTVKFTGYSYSGNWALLRYNMALSEENGDTLNDAIVARNRKVEEELGVKLVMIPLGSSDRSSVNTLQLFIYAQDDVLSFATQMEAGLSKLLTTQGMVQNLRDIPTLNLNASWWNQNANEEYTIYGKQYAAVGDMCLFNLGAPVVVFFSKDLITDNKLDNPYDLVKSGKWTIDNMKTMAAAAAKDVNGDGQADKDDIFGYATEHDMLFYGLFSAEVRFSERDSAGELHPALNNERTVNYTEKMVSFIRDKTTLYYEDWKKGYSNAHSDFFLPKLMNNELLFYSNQLLVTLNLREMESDFGVVPMPKYDEAQKEYYTIANTYFSDHVVIPATNAHPELTGYLLDSLGFYGQQEIRPAFIEKSVLLKGVRDKDSVDMINMVLDNEIFDVGLVFDWGGLVAMFRDMVIKNETNFATRWAGLESKVTSALETSVKAMKGN